MVTGEIGFEGVWKKFQRGERHDSLRDLVPSIVRALASSDHRLGLKREEFWALQDVSFRAGPGDALGIIGPNGAGKTTILRLLTKILRPTSGRAFVTGRVGALIDVAGGFHPDLTGRENVFLRGAIVGMTRSEVTRKYDSIVEFAGLGDFMDTPIKRYSSGMGARLGFSIAAHLDPDVLVIDEVLSVGDAAYQKKAYDRIETMVRSGIPAVVVSHQLERIASLCTQGILLAAGRVIHRGTMADCIAAYTQQVSFPSAPEATSSAVRLDSIEMESPGTVRSGDRVALSIHGCVLEPSHPERRVVGFRLRELSTGDIVFASGTRTHGIALEGGRFVLDVDLQMNVAPGLYTVETYVWHRDNDRLTLNGPSRTIQVEGGAGFVGWIQLNARVRLATPAGALERER